LFYSRLFVTLTLSKLLRLGITKMKKRVFSFVLLSTFRNFAHKIANMTQEEKSELEGRIVDIIKTVYDPEIPVDIWNLGMIYRIEVNDDHSVDIDMTFTAPNCPAADFILEDVRTKVESVEGITSANVNLVFEPEWDKSMMSEEARVELGFE